MVSYINFNFFYELICHELISFRLVWKIDFLFCGVKVSLNETSQPVTISFFIEESRIHVFIVCCVL